MAASWWDASGRQEFVPEVADKVARAGVPVTSTLAVGGYMLRVYGAMERRTAAEQAVFDRWRHMHGVNLANFGRMRAAVVTWVAGTDAGWRFTAFDGLPMEMELMQQGGCSAMGGDHRRNRPRGTRARGGGPDRHAEAGHVGPTSSRLQAIRWTTLAGCAICGW